MTQKQRPTLLEWLKTMSEQQLETAANLGENSSIVPYCLMLDIRTYGLIALERNLSADEQYFLISTYAHIFRD